MATMSRTISSGKAKHSKFTEYVSSQSLLFGYSGVLSKKIVKIQTGTVRMVDWTGLVLFLIIME